MIASRLLLDTNVLISGVLFGGPPGELLTAAREGTVRGVVSLHILGEFREVLLRPRFGFEVSLVDSLIEEIASFCDVAAVENAQGSWTTDPDDDPVIEAALLAGVSAIVSGDRHLLGLDLPQLPVISPSEALSRP